MKLPEPPEGMLPIIINDNDIFNGKEKLLYIASTEIQYEEVDYIVTATRNFNRALDLLFQVRNYDSNKELQLEINDFLISISK